MAILLTREAILSAPVPTTEVEVPEWGGVIKLRSLTHLDRMELLDAINTRAVEVENYEADQSLDAEDREGLAKVEYYESPLLQVLFSIVDDAGARVFTIDDYETFRALNYPTLQRLYRGVLTLENSQAPLDRTALKKSSGTTKAAGSTSG